jgi:hypothetical protein
MKSLLKRLFGPLVRRIEGRISRLITAAVRPVVSAELERLIQPGLDATRAEVHASGERTEEILVHLRRSAQENTLLLDSLVRELVRMQMQLAMSEPAATGTETEAESERLMIGGPASR